MCLWNTNTRLSNKRPQHLGRTRERLIRKIKRIRIRKLIRYGCSRRILERICRRELLPAAMLKEYELRVGEYVSKSHQYPTRAV